MEEQHERALFITIITIIALAAVTSAQDVVYSPPSSLFSDRRAYRSGDVITVLLEEYTSGTNEARSQAEFQNKFKLDGSGSGSLDFIPSMGVQGDVDGDNNSSGLTSRSGALRGKIAARVVKVVGNGNLWLEGRRAIDVNGEKQIVMLKGMVRANDVNADNTIYSYLIADAEITFCGKGEVDQAAKPGIISRFLAWVF
jgi:flagellar L-ring protein precursor FlgH